MSRFSPNPSSPPGRNSEHPKPKLTRRMGVAVLACTALSAAAISPAMASTTTTPASTSSTATIYLGAAGNVTVLSQKSGVSVDTHAYANFTGTVPQGRMITVEAPGRWADVANVKAGTTLYNNIVRWANTIKSRPGPVLLAYQHEPEVASKISLGTATDFINAYRRVVTIFRAQGVTNVSYVWQMTAWAFRTVSTDRQYAAKWYPGDAYVDVVGADAYNWYTCGSGLAKWVELSTLANPAVAFAKAHAKKASLPEFASFVGPQRATWLNNAHTWMTQNKSTLNSAFYFNRGPTNPANMDCSWALSTSAEYAAYASMAHDSGTFRY